MIEILIDDRPAQKVLRDVRGRFVKAGQGTLGPVQKLVRESIEKQFETEGEWGGKAWEPLADTTIRRKVQSHHSAGQLLVNSGDMLRALKDGRARFVGGKVVYQVEDTPAGFHQQGTSRMPQRQIIPEPMPEEFMSKLRNIITGYVIAAAL